MSTIGALNNQHGNVFTPDPSSGNPYIFQLEVCIENYSTILAQEEKNGNRNPTTLSTKQGLASIPMCEAQGSYARRDKRKLKIIKANAGALAFIIFN